MTISALLSQECIFLDTDISSKKRLLEFIAKTAAEQYQLTQSSVYNNLLDRERLGSTGLGKGFAIPHARLSDLDKIICYFIKLAHPINYESPDSEPVDLVFTIIVPQDSTDEHLQILSALAKLFSQRAVGTAIRNANSRAEISEIIYSAEQ